MPVENLRNTIFSHLKNLGKLDNVNKDDYEFLNTQKEIARPVMIGLGGSHAYGTNVPGSDLDIRGIAMHSKEDILLGRGFEQFVNEQTDTVIYSLEKAVGLFADCNPNMIEMLGLKTEHYMYMSDIGFKIYDNKDMFLSNRCIKTFMGYANQQMYRLKQKTLDSINEEELNAHIVKTIDNMRFTLEDQYDLKGIKFDLVNGEIVLDLNVENYPVEKLSAVLGVFNKTVQDYNKRSKRNDYAMTHNKIAKHSMHLLRLYMMCEDLLLKGEINTYREKEHDLLMDIRNGRYLDETGKPVDEFFDMVEEYENRMDYAKNHSVLPDKPDIKRINKLLIEANESLFQ